ncbi:MAG: PD-(D/E)XK nuclease family protein, partial [Candidatus Aminicenantes bacterium]|nr:PD-(D/E)XK nuclease family protein [Candidatus Aminicenantes bacterium]
MSPAKVRLVPPQESLIEAAAEALAFEDRDYSRSWVLFPERRPAYYLRKYLAGRAGAGFIPPRTFSLDAFVDHVYAERLGLRDRLIDPLDAVALLLDIQRSAPDRLGRAHFLTADHFFPLGLKLYRDLEELTAAGVSAGKLENVDTAFQDAVSGMLTEPSKARLQALSFFQEQFLQAVSAEGFSTPALRLQAVAGAVSREMFPDVDRFVFAGFFGLNKAEETLVRRMAGWDGVSLLFHRAAGIDDVLDRLGLDSTGSRGPVLPAAKRPEISFTACPDTHGQVFALNAVLREKMADPARFDERQVIVLPAAETLFPLYQQTLSDLPRDRFNISLGYPLTRTPIFTFFERLLTIHQSSDGEGRVYAPDYIRFVLHPYAKNIRFPGPERRSDLTRILFHAVEEALTEKKGRAFWSLAEIESLPAVRETVERLARGVEGAPIPAAFLDQLGLIHGALIEPLRTVSTVGEFAEKLIRILHFIYENGTARRHYFFHPYAEAFISRLERLAGSRLRGERFQEREGYFNLFRKVAAAGAVPFFGTPLRGLQVLGFWETRGIPFEDVYLLDVNEDVLPASKSGDSLLPLGVRRHFGLPTHRDREREIEHSLDVLIGGARRVHLFFVESRDRERSRSIERLLWESRKRDPDRASETPVLTVRYTSNLRPHRPPDVSKTPDVVEGLRRLTYSATSLDVYLKCSLRFYYRYVLGLKEREELDEEIEARDIGNIVHRVLEEDFKPLVGRDLRPEDFPADRIERRVEAVFRDVFGENLSGRPYLMMLQTKRHLSDYYVNGQAEIVRRARKENRTILVRALEKRAVAVRSDFRISGRFDRLETRGQDLYLLDYKTSADAAKYGVRWNKLVLDDRTTWLKTIGSLQMPLYSILAADLEGKTAGDIQGRFVMLGKSRMSPDIEVSPYDAKDGRKDVTPEKRAERVALMGQLIDRLLAEIVNPGVPFVPAAESDRVCGYCDFKNLCNR